MSRALNACPGCRVAGGGMAHGPGTGRAGMLSAEGRTPALRPKDPFGLLGKWGQGRGASPGDNAPWKAVLGGLPIATPGQPAFWGGDLWMGSGSLLPGFPWPICSNSHLLTALWCWGGPGQAAGGAQLPAALLEEQNNPPLPCSGEQHGGLRGEHGVTGLLSSSCKRCRDSGGDAPASIHR